MVYFVQAKNSLIKIGMTTHLAQRLCTLRKEHGDIVLLAIIPGEQRDSDYHVKFRDYWFSGEWFAPEDELLTFIQAIPTTAECPGAVAYGRTGNVTLNPDCNFGRYPRPLDPVVAARRAECADILRNIPSGESLESRISNCNSLEEIQDLLHAASVIAAETPIGVFWGR